MHLHAGYTERLAAEFWMINELLEKMNNNHLHVEHNEIQKVVKNNDKFALLKGLDTKKERP